MGVYDREYMRSRGVEPVRLPRSWTVRLMVLLGVAYVVVKGSAGWFGIDLEGPLALSRAAIERGRVWTLLTAALVHAGAWHLILNLAGLWFFGRLVEESLGSVRFAWFCLLAAVVSHLPFLVAAFAVGGRTATIGASGVVMACLVHAAFRFPGLPAYLFVIPLKLWQLAALFVALDVYGALSQGTGIDHLTHLGGAAYGWFVHRFGLLPRFRLPVQRPTPGRPTSGPYREGNDARIDALLDKIARDGIATLTDEEREFLRRHSGAYRGTTR